MKELKKLLPYIKRYRYRIFLGFLFVTISNFCSTYLPRIVGSAVDMISSGEFVMEDIYTAIAKMLGLTIGSGIFMFLTRRTIIVASRMIEYDLRDDLILSFQARPMNFFHINKTGSLMAHATNDIPAAREFIGPAIMYSANTITTFAFVMYFMFSINVEISLFVIAPLPIVALTTFYIGKKVHIAFRNVQEQFGILSTLVQETFSGIRVVRAYNRENYENLLFSDTSRDYLDKNIKLAKYQAITMPLLMLIIGLSMVAILGYGGYKVIQGAATIGDLTQFFIYLNQLIWPVAAIGWITNIIQRASASAGRLSKLMEGSREIDFSEEEDSSITNINGDIEFKDITFSYEKESAEVLKNINFKAPLKSTLGIVGGVGSGKSTIINLLPRLYEIDKGEIKIDGIRTKEIPVKLLRSSIGIVPQETFLFSDTIRENILFGRPDATEEDVIQAAKMAQFHDEVVNFRDGYDTMLGERGVNLSGGQKQRLAIARAILKNPKILILDDSLSAVDASTEERILRELKKIMKERTTIVISHRLSAVSHADEIILLDDGEIAERGTHDELVALGGRYHSIYQKQKLEEEIEMS